MCASARGGRVPRVGAHGRVSFASQRRTKEGGDVSEPSRRWQTRFGSFVACVTVGELRRSLASVGHPVTARAVYSWVQGARLPRLDVAVALERMSGGVVSAADILMHSREVGGNGAGSGTGVVAGGASERTRRD